MANYIYSYVKIIWVVFIGFLNEITCEMVKVDKFYYMKTINSIAEGYFHSCRFPCASQYVLEQALSVTTNTGAARCGTADIC